MDRTVRRALAGLFGLSALHVAAQQPAVLIPAAEPRCTRITCEDYDAVVFVHGIYGSDETFKNLDTGFDWPSSFPRRIRERDVDVYRLDYRSALLSWAKQSNPDFKDAAASFVEQLRPLRGKRYRSIGFIAHSLGGNLTSTYFHLIKSGQGHPERSQHAYIITLATPVLGADIASLGSTLKQLLQIDDRLLASLTKNNLYLQMLLEFREAEDGKGFRYGCRRVNLHAAFEQARVGPLTVVAPDSAALSIASLVSSPVIGFPLDHFAIAKPQDSSDPVYTWVQERVTSEFARLDEWDLLRGTLPWAKRLCAKVDFIGDKR